MVIKRGWFVVVAFQALARGGGFRKYAPFPTRRSLIRASLVCDSLLEIHGNQTRGGGVGRSWIQDCEVCPTTQARRPSQKPMVFKKSLEKPFK